MTSQRGVFSAEASADVLSLGRQNAFNLKDRVSSLFARDTELAPPLTWDRGFSECKTLNLTFSTSYLPLPASYCVKHISVNYLESFLHQVTGYINTIKLTQHPHHCLQVCILMKQPNRCLALPSGLYFSWRSKPGREQNGLLFPGLHLPLVSRIHTTAPAHTPTHTDSSLHIQKLSGFLEKPSRLCLKHTLVVPNDDNKSKYKHLLLEYVRLAVLNSLKLLCKDSVLFSCL